MVISLYKINWIKHINLTLVRILKNVNLKTRFLFLIILIPFLVYGNMAKPYFDGDYPTSIYGSKECDVIKENIFINLVKIEDNLFEANYTIEYYINSYSNQSFPLVFFGINLKNVKSVVVNGNDTDFINSKLSKTQQLFYDKLDSLLVNSNELISFNASLQKGTNKIILEYSASLGFNTYGFITNNDIKYSLYPSKFWKSFGEVNIELNADDKIEIISSNIGDYVTDGKFFKWKIKSIKHENIEIRFRRSINLLSKGLLYMQPLGISSFFLLILVALHLWGLKQKHLYKKFNYSLKLGNIFVPLLFYFFYFISYWLIDLTLGQKNSRHGYVFLIIFTLPFFWVIYSLLMYIFDRIFKKKYTSNNNKL